MTSTDMSPAQILEPWSNELLRLFLQCRNVSISTSDAENHSELIALAEKSASLPIVSIPGTPVSVLNLLSLSHLGFYLGKKRGFPLNANSRWLRYAPPKMGRVKRDAVLDFALKEYADVIKPDPAALEQFDKDIAETLREEIVISRDSSGDIMSVYLLDDDIQVLYETWGIPLDPKHSLEDALSYAQSAASFFAKGIVVSN